MLARQTADRNALLARQAAERGAQDIALPTHVVTGALTESEHSSILPLNYNISSLSLDIYGHVIYGVGSHFGSSNRAVISRYNQILPDINSETRSAIRQNDAAVGQMLSNVRNRNNAMKDSIDTAIGEEVISTNLSLRARENATQTLENSVDAPASVIARARDLARNYDQYQSDLRRRIADNTNAETSLQATHAARIERMRTDGRPSFEITTAQTIAQNELNVLRRTNSTAIANLTRQERELIDAMMPYQADVQALMGTANQ